MPLRELDLPFEGTTIHCWAGGQGMPLVLLHGSGAGCATFSNFKRVVDPLSAKFHVLAADLIGFGKSGRKSTEPYFDMGMWVRQARCLIDFFPDAKVGLVGHSLSGPIVLKAAARNPRVAGVITTGTAGVSNTATSGGPAWRFPETRQEVRAAIERTLYDKSLADDAEVESRLSVLQEPGYREYFTRMFGGDKAALLQASALADDDLSGISCPLTLMHGAQDASFSPEDTSLRIAKKIPHADVIILNRCAHSVALEHPRKFIAAVEMTLI